MESQVAAPTEETHYTPTHVAYESNYITQPYVLYVHTHCQINCSKWDHAEQCGCVWWRRCRGAQAAKTNMSASSTSLWKSSFCG